MSPDGSLFPNVAEFFQYLPFTGETNSTMSNNKPAPIIVRPFPDIQTYIGVRFQHTIPINPSYIVSPNGEDTDKLLLSAKFDPSSAEKWVQFDEKSRKLVGNPTEDANKNTTVLLHISDPAGGSTDTTMNILVSNCVGERCIKHVPREILAVAITLSAAFGVCLLITFGFILFRKYKRINEKKSINKQTNEVFSVESDNEGGYNDQASRENIRIYEEKEIRSQVAMYNFQNVAITDATRLETSYNSEISNVGARMPWKIEREASSTDVSLTKNRKIIHKESSGSSLYSYSSAAASCDNISQSMTLSGIKRMEVPENCVSNIPVIYATPGSSFIYQVEYPLPSLTHYGLQEFMAVTDPDGGPIPKWLNFNKMHVTFSGVPSKVDVGQTSIKVLKVVGGVNSHDVLGSHVGTGCLNNFKVVENFLLIVEDDNQKY